MNKDYFIENQYCFNNGDVDNFIQYAKEIKSLQYGVFSDSISYILEMWIDSYFGDDTLTQATLSHNIDQLTDDLIEELLKQDYILEGED